MNAVFHITNCWVCRDSRVCPLSTGSVESEWRPRINLMPANSTRGMRSGLWRGGKTCGLRVDQDLTNRRFIHRDRPPVTVVTMRAADRARQRKTDFTRAHLLVGAH